MLAHLFVQEQAAPMHQTCHPLETSATIENELGSPVLATLDFNTKGNAVRQGEPLHRSHPYTFSDFYRFDTKSGTLLTATMQRACLVGDELIHALHTVLDAELGDQSAAPLYKCGYYWGAADVRRFEAQVIREFGSDPQHVSLSLLLTSYWWPLRAMGFGLAEFDLALQEKGVIVVNLFDSLVAKTLGDTEKHVCYLYSGLFAGVLSFLSRRALASIEVECYSQGVSHCKFLVANEKRIRQFEAGLEEGLTFAEVLETL